MEFYGAAIINDLQIPVFETDPPSGSLNSEGLIWYNKNVGALRFTYNFTGSDGAYCTRTLCCIR
jgi:hypothetical protein